jgi:hypothetical protein
MILADCPAWDSRERVKIMELSNMLDAIKEAMSEGRTVTIKADEITIKADEMTANGLEITVE